MTVPEHLLKRSKQLRDKQTPAENVLWSLLRDRQLGGFKFRRQHVIFSYIVDFCCYAEKLIVELDGAYHMAIKAKEHDNQREAFLSANGYRIIRFKNVDVFDQQEQVLQTILAYIKQVPSQGSALISPRGDVTTGRDREGSSTRKRPTI
ncbi:MAG: DUF559 domain-containing protein [Candidatus Marinimicrobia bacterium]|nr:DUF559 domain-containing protein [Candidatus Neomarinimicrobiota bacterium]